MERLPVARVRRGHTGAITGLACDASGHRLLTGAEDGLVIAWDPRTAVACGALRCGSAVHAVALSPDGATVAVGLLEGAALLCPARLEATGSGEGPERDSEVRPPGVPREPRSIGAKALTIDGAAVNAAAVAWSPDGAIVATGSGSYTAARHPITLWRADGTLIGVLDAHRYRVRALAFSPDGELLASGSDDDSVILWRVATREQVAVVPMKQDVEALGWSLDGERLYAAAYDTVEVLDRRGQRVGGWQDHIVRGLHLCPDGEHLATVGLKYGGPGAIKLWTLAGVRVHEQLGGDDVRAVAYLPDGQLAVASRAVVRIYWGPQCRSRLEDPVVRVVSLASAGEQLALGGTDGVARLGNRQSPLAHSSQAVAGQWVTRLAFSPDGRRLALGSAGAEGGLVDTASGERIAALPQGGEQWALAWSPDGARLASAAYDGVLVLWDGATGARGREISLAETKHHVAVFSADGSRLNVGSTDGLLRIWDPRSGEGLANQRCSRGILLALALSPDGRLLATGGEDARARLWVEETGKNAGEITGPRLAVNDVRFSADGKWLLAAGGDGTVYLCDVESRSVVRKLEGHEGIVGAAAFWPNDATVVSAGMDGQVIFWNAATAERIATLHLVGDGGWLLATPDGRFEVSADALGAVVVDRSARRVEQLWSSLFGR